MSHAETLSQPITDVIHVSPARAEDAGDAMELLRSRAMRTLLTALAVLFAGACAGDSPSSSGVDSGRKCEGKLYDRCLEEHDCGATQPDCHNFAGDNIQVCTKTCTVGDDATCGTTLDGRAATCNMMGICKPPGANDCVR